jgi:hypoxanthine-guanine phosphoribosyltransferase
VREYWLVDIDSKTLLANTAKDGEWIGRAYGEEDKVPVTVLPGCVIDLGGVFGEMITELTNKEEEI